MRGLLRTPGFDPAQARRRFRLAMSDYGARIILPQLMRELRRDAPGIDLAVTQGSREAMQAQLMDGELDLALGVFIDPPKQILTAPLFREHFISVADRTTLPATGSLSLDAWLARPHVLVAMRIDGENEIDAALAAASAKRRVTLVMPHWSTALEVIAGTDLILTVASRCVPASEGGAGWLTFAPPIPFAPFEFQQAWHNRRDNDPAHVWFRDRVAQCAALHR